MLVLVQYTIWLFAINSFSLKTKSVTEIGITKLEEIAKSVKMLKEWIIMIITKYDNYASLDSTFCPEIRTVKIIESSRSQTALLQPRCKQTLQRHLFVNKFRLNCNNVEHKKCCPVYTGCPKYSLGRAISKTLRKSMSDTYQPILKQK